VGLSFAAIPRNEMHFLEAVKALVDYAFATLDADIVRAYAADAGE